MTQAEGTASTKGTPQVEACLQCLSNGKKASGVSWDQDPDVESVTGDPRTENLTSPEGALALTLREMKVFNKAGVWSDLVTR